ncbi:hypothetical protein ACI8AC_02450 [Geodermatophilus sp. SYSU D00758]
MPVPERLDSPLRPPRGDVSGPAAPSSPPDRTPGRLPLRGLTGWEEEYLERHQAEPNTARLCNEVLARCLVQPGDDPGEARRTVRDLLVAERDRELVALRRMSLGPQVTARVDCPACGEAGEVEFSLDALPLEFPKPPPHLDVVVPGIGEVRLRLPTAGDQEDLGDADLTGAAERRSWLLARCLLRYGDRTDGFDLDFSRSLPVLVRAVLEAAVEGNLPDLALEMAIDCPHCGAAVTAPFDVPNFFFRADRAGAPAAARCAPDRPRLPLVRTRHPRAAAGPSPGLPPAAGGRGRRRPARRAHRRRLSVAPRGR